jgi:hypothetical protein
MTDRIFKIGPDGSTTIEPRPVDPPSEDAPNPEDSAAKEKAAAQKQKDRLANQAIQEMTFSTHVLSLNATALYHLGLLEEDGALSAPDFEAAAQVIDTLAMLKDKTRGNLNETETRLLDTVLYDLRVQYARLHK